MLAVKNQLGELVGESLQFVTFELPLGERTLSMALNVQKVKEVVEISEGLEISMLPSGCEQVLGIYDLRGCPVPVLNIPGILTKKREAEPLAKGRLLICELQNTWIAFPVEKTGRIVTCPSSDFLPPPPGSSIDKSRVISGLVRKGKSYVPVLDIDSIMDMAGLNEDGTSKKQVPVGRYAGKRILVIDDSRIVLKRLVEFFTRLGFTVDSAKNGEEGLRLFAEHAGSYHLVFTDIEMPVLDGIAMTREIRRLPEGAVVPILFNSALSNTALVSDLQSEGLGQYIVKFDEDLILSKLEALLGA